MGRNKIDPKIKIERRRKWEARYREKNHEKLCMKNQKWQKEHPEKCRESCRNYYYANRDKLSENRKIYNLANKEKIKRYNTEYNGRDEVRAARHGLVVKEYQELISKMGTMCPICKRSFGEIPPCIDHNHRTGVVRGIICDSCNKALGFLDDNVDTVFNIIKYLRGEIR